MTLLLSLIIVSANPALRFETEYPQASRALKENMRPIRGVAEVTELGGDARPAKKFGFATGPDRVKFEFDSFADKRRNPSSPIRNNVCCRVEDLCFRLERRSNEREFGITIRSATPLAQGMIHSVFGKYLDSAWCSGIRDIPRLMSLDAYRILESKEIHILNRTLIEITLEVPSGPTAKDQLQVTFDPDRHWALVRSEVRSGALMGRVVEQKSIEYGPDIDGHHWIKKVQMTGADGRKTLCEFQPVNFTKTPDQEFTLSFYGLSDPVRGPSRSGFPRGMALMTALILGLFAGSWAIRRSRLAK